MFFVSGDGSWETVANQRLSGKSYRTMYYRSLSQCKKVCEVDAKCFSLNYHESKTRGSYRVCELNSANRTTAPESLTKSSSYTYYERHKASKSKKELLLLDVISEKAGISWLCWISLRHILSLDVKLQILIQPKIVIIHCKATYFCDL